METAIVLLTEHLEEKKANLEGISGTHVDGPHYKNIIEKAKARTQKEVNEIELAIKYLVTHEEVNSKSVFERFETTYIKNGVVVSGPVEPPFTKSQTRALQNLMFEIASWSDKTFGSAQRNPGIIHHLKEEVKELLEVVTAYEASKPDGKLLKESKYEYADCLMLLLDSAYHIGFSAEELIFATFEKLEVNKNREWQQPDENGLCHHIKKQ